MNFIKNKKAFTLIELLVVIAVIGILVLLGIPRFIGHTQKAELTRIQHDIKVMEQEVGTVLSTDYDDFNEWENNSNDLNQLAQEGKLFQKEGPVAKEVESIDGPYKVIPEKHKDKINTKLKGTFYANSNGKVYYEHLKPLSGIPADPEKPTEPGEKEPVLEGPIPIATAEELNNVRNATIETYGAGTQWEGLYEGGLDKQYFQVADIDLSEYSEEGWNPIGTLVESNTGEIDFGASFTGTYDGGNYVITGLEVKDEDKDYQGLFGATNGATIRNVGLIDNKVTGINYVGGLVGTAWSSTISNSYTTGSVEGTNRVGGLVGEAQISTISSSHAKGSVTGGEYVGGLVGYHYNDTISNSYATGSVEGSSKAGGLVGYAGFSPIEKSYAIGKVTGTGDRVGGLVGETGGVTTRISNSYATSSVTGANEVGGLVGYQNHGTMENSYATGAVEGTGKEIGGLVGLASWSKIEKSYATGSAKGTSRVGGLVGWAQGKNTTISNSYWDKDTTKLTWSAGQDELFGKSTYEMKKQATYSGWDFTNIWEITPGNYPTFR